VAGGTVLFAPLAPPWAITNAPVTVTYNPVSYTTPTDYSTKFTLTAGAELTQRMLVFPEVTKTYDGTTTATLVSLKGNPTGVSLVADPGSTAVFNSADAGTGKTVTFTGYRLAGPDAARFALATACCGPIVSKTTGTITAARPFTGMTVLAMAGPATDGLAMSGPALFSLDMMPTPYAGNDDVFLALAEEEEAVPTAIPLKPYVARRYAPKPERN